MVCDVALRSALIAVRWNPLSRASVRYCGRSVTVRRCPGATVVVRLPHERAGKIAIAHPRALGLSGSTRIALYADRVLAAVDEFLLLYSAQARCVKQTGVVHKVCTARRAASSAAVERSESSG